MKSMDNEYMVSSLSKKEIAKAVHDYIADYHGVAYLVAANPIYSVKELFCKSAKESRGVKVKINNNTISLVVYIVIEFTLNISTFVHQLRNDIKNFTEYLTKMNIGTIDINIKDAVKSNI